MTHHNVQTSYRGESIKEAYKPLTELRYKQQSSLPLSAVDDPPFCFNNIQNSFKDESIKEAYKPLTEVQTAKLLTLISC